jgi:hypothetical protein
LVKFGAAGRVQAAIMVQVAGHPRLRFGLARDGDCTHFLARGHAISFAKAERAVAMCGIGTRLSSFRLNWRAALFTCPPRKLFGAAASPSVVVALKVTSTWFARPRSSSPDATSLLLPFPNPSSPISLPFCTCRRNRLEDSDLHGSCQLPRRPDIGCEILSGGWFFKTPSLPHLTLFEFAARNNPESVPMRVLCPCLCLLHLPGSREKGVPSLRCASHATHVSRLFPGSMPCSRVDSERTLGRTAAFLSRQSLTKQEQQPGSKYG